ncbi:arsenic resistance N-acetyltransferase ArsN2 [Agrobacterium larrymoorei]|uniref:Arsenic resistance N-acetyltransferase ArsN2 n=1 Tax=Agrobacterium larrymoorei TaxID=160699 RepID=A0AAF0HEW8_9HYPH|nr:arsenic resistance N-acetyltransferase ArsN2 [Agrobacterium larrymoorei]WHA43269.1 arsenic resistance N-acetyltransferase ArsN2 [Agrobacterium larrymoorei]
MSIELVPVSGSDAEFKHTLVRAGLPTADLEDEGRSFFRAVTSNGDTVGYCGLEACGGDVLLRSLVVLESFRGRGFGRTLAEATVEKAGQDVGVFLATTSAAPIFERLGFVPVDRHDVPVAVLSTRQLSGICPSSATIMKLSRPPA